MVIRVVQIHDVDTIHAKPIKAAFQRSKNSVAAEVPFPAEVRGYIEPVIVELMSVLRCRYEQSPHFGRDDYFVSRVFRKGSTKALFGEAQPVVGCGIEVAHPAVPCGIDGSGGVLVAGLAIKVSESRRADSDLRER